jgi:hypothetical protein
MDFDHRTVVHDERYVSPEGIHVNQVELSTRSHFLLNMEL